MTTLRADSDVLILGSPLGGLVAGSYLARAGLRVVLVDGAAHGKRPAILRDPFPVPGPARHGAVFDDIIPPTRGSDPLLTQESPAFKAVVQEVAQAFSKIDAVRAAEG